MKLQSLHIVGFKTFADRTTLEPGPGITAVVGPNGCGKSNIADALLWALGEQNPRLLRASEAKEIIFAGCKTRKPLGMAEVRLVLDNSDLSLPIQLAEVTVTRRIFRSGETQYLINNSPCRLKDVADLFMDTGAGRGAYAVVGQGEIDAILSARPEERRELFEEAAGIKKYRTRKREALRKLEAAEANLVRVRDILTELEQQREPLAQQAEAAKRYNALSRRLHTIELEVLLAEAARAESELQELREQRERYAAMIADIDARLATLERESERAGHDLAQAEQEQDAAAISRQSALTTLERLESRLHLTQERATHARATAERTQHQIAELNERAATIADELCRVTEQQQAAAALVTRQEEELEEARRAALRLTERANQAQADLEQVQLQWTRATQQQAEARVALEAATARLAEMETRVREMEELANELATQEASARDSVRALEASEQQCAAQHAALSARKHELAAAAQNHQRQVAQCRKDVEAAQMRLAEATTRLTVLREVHAAGEGLYQGVRAILKAQRENRLSGPFWAIVDILSVPSQYRTAIEVALGPAMQDLVCPSQEAARQAIEWLKQTRAGRATFLPLDFLTPQPPLNSDLFVAHQGAIGVASALVTFDARFQPAVDLLLGRTVVTRDLPTATQIAKSIRGWNRIVTLDGELITPGGAITGGSIADRGVHLVARKGEIDDLAQETRNLQEDVRAKVQTLTEMEQRRKAVDQELAACEEALTLCAVQRAEWASRHRAAEQECRNLGARLREAQGEAQKLRHACHVLREERRHLEESAAAMNQSPTEDDGTLVEQAKERYRAAVSAAEEARSRLGIIEVEHARMLERLKALTADADRLHATLRDTQTRIAAAERERQTALTDLEHATTAAEAIQAERAQAQALLAHHQEEWTSWRERRQSLLAENYERASAMKEARTRRSEASENLHATDLKIARTEARLAQTLDRLMEEYAISREEARNRCPSATSGAPDDIAKEITALRREIKAMGPVNTGALEEYERLSQRLSFLSEQRKDLEEARQSLAATIAEIDASSRTLFLDTLEAVSRQFDQLFQRLFHGGTARIRLTDSADPLEAGIEIEAQPPGKSRQPLSLLSGGERALTALALLFSFLAVRPSPFCILDEVDAPLDGANVEHFADLLRDFSASTQFLVITHNPATIACADRWYGVTMEEPGVSKVLHYRVPPMQSDLGNNESAHSSVTA